jgi:hypothetical protein
MNSKDEKMAREQGVRQKPRDDDAAKPRDKGQGIVRDERGQEQPADKERAQRAVKTGKAG